MRLVTPLEMMKLEDLANQAGVTYEKMMEAAGTGLAAHLAKFAESLGTGAIVFLCGNGNNAGDCFVAAKLLSARFRVTVCLTNGIPKTRTAYTKYKEMGDVAMLTDPAEIKAAVAQHQLIVDGVFGIGFRGELSPAVRELFAVINADKEKKCIAVDIPSGGNALGGTVAAGAPRCAATITFGAAKRGLLMPPLSEYCGMVQLVEIGIPQEAFDALGYPVSRISANTVKAMLPPRPDNSHKGMFGKLLIVAGSRNMPGAAMLAVQAALRSGVGLCCIASEESVCRMVVSSAPECMMLPVPTDAKGMLCIQSVKPILDYAKGCTAVLIGPGLGLSGEIRQMVGGLLRALNCPVILDADGLNAVADSIDILQEVKKPVILTPHPAEMGRLMSCSVNEVQKDRIASAKKLAERFPKTVVVLKGAGTVVANAEHAAINMTGNSGMSKGGSGDVLAGIIGGLTAQQIPPEASALCGVYLHGLAGDCAAAEFSKRAMLPSDLIRQLPLVFGDYD
ncbi:MAG: NAD(P)H-hydrate dehydratase [Oscillospiraceae bacterium]|nr:NAD(P)H-hydrate dehydratase [Oscillospiraceae bacterium]